MRETLKVLGFVSCVLIGCGGGEQSGGSAGPAASSAAKTAAPASSGMPTGAASGAASAAPMKMLSKLPGKLAKPLGQSTPEDIQKACSANGLKCELKKIDDDEGKKFGKYNISFGDSGLWVNIWTYVGAPEDRVKSATAPGGRPAAADGKMLISIDASDAKARDDEAKRVLDALVAK